MTEASGDKVAFIFPGQGVQFVGMGKDLYETSPAARQVFDTADTVLGIALTKLCFEGPEDILTNTYNAQSAILTTSVACLMALREKLDAVGATLTPDFVAGHSLGEYTALIAAGAFSFEDGLKLVRERGRLMDAADQQYPGGMAAVLGLDVDEVRKVVAEASPKGIIATANFNCPGQVVITGAEEPLEEAMRLAKEHGAKKVVRLAISIASHSPLMRPATADLAQAIKATPMRDAQVPLVGNVTGQALSKVDEIKSELSEQLCSSVLWSQSVRYMTENGVGTFYEIGPGSTLSGMVKRINREVKTISLSDAKTIDAFVAAYSAS